MEKKVESYCELFRAVYERVSKVCPEGAKDVALKIVEEIAKDLRTEAIQSKAKSEEVSVSEELATKKQREALHKFGVKRIPENLSLKEASEILDRLIGFSKEGDSESIAETVGELNRKWSQQQ